jgi:hypothetical protein
MYCRRFFDFPHRSFAKLKLSPSTVVVYMTPPQVGASFGDPDTRSSKIATASSESWSENE